MKAGKIPRTKATHFDQNHRKNIPPGHLHGGRGGGSQVVRAGFGLHGAQQAIIPGGDSQGAGRIPGDGHQPLTPQAHHG